jgi:hypothetical protein
MDISLKNDVNNHLSYEIKEIVGKIIREILEKDKIIRLDFSRMAVKIESWWKKQKGLNQVEQKSVLRQLFFKNFNKDELFMLQSFGRSNSDIAAIVISNVFSSSDRNLAAIVHEALSEISGIVNATLKTHNFANLKAQIFAKKLRFY